MNPKRALRDYLARLYVPKAKSNLFGQLDQYLDIINVRFPTKEDAYKGRCPILVIYTKGKGTRETFEDYRVKYADFDSIGEKYALAYVYDETGGKPQRLDITSVKTMIVF